MQIIQIAQEKANPNKIDLNGTKLTVYHRTKSSELGESICSVGFKAGGGAAYGVGIYSTYNYKSSLQNYNLESYGTQIIKSEMDINGFLIFDIDMAKAVYGDKYKLIDQIKIIGEDKIFNRSQNRQKQIAYIEETSNKLEHSRFTAPIANGFVARFRLDSTGLNGIIYTGSHDGRCALAYKVLLITPLAHAYVDGSTYRNPKWERCPDRTIEELKKLRANEEDAKKFVSRRMDLLNDIQAYDENNEVINLSKENYPEIPDGIFDDIVLNFLFEDDTRIERLSESLKEKYKDVIEVDFMIKKLRMNPEHYWKEWMLVGEDVRKQIPQTVIIGIWEDFLKVTPSAWEKTPPEIRPFLSKDASVKYFLKTIKQNPENWSFVPKDILQEIHDNKLAIIPDNIIESKISLNATDLSIEKAQEILPETVEFDVSIDNEQWVKREIEDINKRAIYLGLPRLEWEVLNIDRKNRIIRMKIVGNVPVSTGWKLIAQINITRSEDENGNEKLGRLIFPLTDKPIPESLNLETIDLKCQKCNEDRYRKEIYIIQNIQTEVYKVIGSSCLQYFISGIGEKTADSVAEFAAHLRKMIMKFKEDAGEKNEKKRRSEFRKNGVPVGFFLRKILKLQKQNPRLFTRSNILSGYHKNKVSKELAKAAWATCMDSELDKKLLNIPVTVSDFNAVEEMIRWVLTAPEPPPQVRSDILWQIRKTCENGTVVKRRKHEDSTVFPMAKLPSLYEKHVKQERDYGKLLGKVGDQIFFKGTIKNKQGITIEIIQQLIQDSYNADDYVPSSSTSPTTNPVNPVNTVNPVNPVAQTVSAPIPNAPKKTSTNKEYYIAEDNEGSKVSWLQTLDKDFKEGDIIFIKATIESYGNIDAKSITNLKDVTVIDDKEYDTNESNTENNKKIFRESHKDDNVKYKSGMKRYYREGEEIEEDFKIYYWSYDYSGKNKQICHILDDDDNRLIFEYDYKIGTEGEKIRLKGKIRYRSQYHYEPEIMDIEVIKAGTIEMTTTTTTLIAQQIPAPISQTPIPSVPTPQLPKDPATSYYNGQTVINDFTVTIDKGRGKWGNARLFELKDPEGRILSTFTILNLRQGETVKLQGMIHIKPPYINLVNPKKVDANTPNTSGNSSTSTAPTAPAISTTVVQPTPASTVMQKYQNGQIVEDNFKITSIKGPYRGKMLYQLKDSFGRSVSLFTNQKPGNVNDEVRLRGDIRINYPYVNLENVIIIPKKQPDIVQAPTPPQTQQTQQVQEAPQIQQVKQVQPSDIVPETTALTWYSNFKVSTVLDEFKKNDGSQPNEINEGDIVDPEIVKKNFKYPDEINRDAVYDNFKANYEKATGKTWDKSKFLRRSSEWVFYGDENGYIALRPQHSGFYKLVGIAGNDKDPTAKMKSLLQALKTIQNDAIPVWGMVSSEIKNILSKLGFKSPPPTIIKMLMGIISPNVFGGAILKDVHDDGSANIVYHDIGETTKYFVGNSQYYKKLSQNIDSNERIPELMKFPVKKAIELLASKSNGRNFVLAKTNINFFEDVET